MFLFHITYSLNIKQKSISFIDVQSKKHYLSNTGIKFVNYSRYVVYIKPHMNSPLVNFDIKIQSPCMLPNTKNSNRFYKTSIINNSIRIFTS